MLCKLGMNVVCWREQGRIMEGEQLTMDIKFQLDAGESSDFLMHTSIDNYYARSIPKVLGEVTLHGFVMKK